MNSTKLLTLVLILTILVSSCEKETNFSSPQSHTLTIKGSSNLSHPNAAVGSMVQFQVWEGRLILNNAEDFSLLMWALEEQNLPAWETSIGFKSLRARHKSKDLKEHEISSVLNKDGLIQINPYLFKLDFEQQKVYVLSLEYIQYLEDLRAVNPSNSLIKIFDFEDDVWALLKESKTSENITESTTKKCSEPKSKNKQVQTEAASCVCTPYYWQVSTISLRYNRFGIWETVKAYYANKLYHVIGQNNNHYTNANLIEGRIYYHFNERCGSTYYGTLTLAPGQYKLRTYILRSNKKPLERNKSIINMFVSTSYVISPAEPIQHLNTKLNNF